MFGHENKEHILNNKTMKDQIRDDAQRMMDAGKAVLILVDEVAHGEELSKQLDIDDSICEHNEIKSNDINNWTDKYGAKTLNDIIDNKEQINKLKNWLLNFETSKYHTAVIS